MTEHPTEKPQGGAPSPALFCPHEKTARGEPSRGARSLPADLREQATRRLQRTAILYSTGFFCADFLPEIINGSLAQKFSHPANWVLSAASIVTGLLFAALISTPRL